MLITDLLLLELEDLADQRLVHLARARDVRTVELLPHRALLDEFERRQVRGHVKAQLPRARLGRRAFSAALGRA